MKLTVPNIEIKDNEGFSSDKDIFSRKDFGERLASLVEQSQGGLVLALDAQWGEGKSTFIRMWRGHIGHVRDKKIKSIYFDAFENDYQKDPFLALAAEIYELTKDKSKEKREEFEKKASNAVKSMVRGALKIGVRAASGGILDGTCVDSAEQDISTLLSDQVDLIISDRLKNTTKDKLAISQFREYLEEFASNEKEPIVFIIDELDRCRPDFALELIEQIKHLFSVNGITFLLVLNRTQLEESIRARYGNKVGATLYLQKFVTLWLSLPRKSDQYKDHGAEYVKHAINSMLVDDEQFQNFDSVELLIEIVKSTKPSFREIEHILSHFSLIHNMDNSSRFFPSYQMMIAFISYLKASKPDLITRITNSDISANDLISLSKISATLNGVEFMHIDYLFKIITFDLGSDDVRTKMLDQKEIVNDAFGRDQKNIMITVCGWLTEMHLN